MFIYNLNLLDHNTKIFLNEIGNYEQNKNILIVLFCPVGRNLIELQDLIANKMVVIFKPVKYSLDKVDAPFTEVLFLLVR